MVIAFVAMVACFSIVTCFCRHVLHSERFAVKSWNTVGREKWNSMMLGIALTPCIKSSTCRIAGLLASGLT